MAEFVIKRKDFISNDLVKNQRGCYKRGDIISVRDDGDTLSHQTVIKIPGLSKKDALNFIESTYDTSHNIITRRKWRIPSNIMDILFPNDTVTTVTVELDKWEKWKSKIESKI